MVVVTGPRIDPATIPAAPGLEVHGFVPDLLPPLLAACDLAIVQGGLTTTMELAALPAGRSSTCRCATTSSRTGTCGTGWPTTGPAGACPTTSSTRTTLAGAIAAGLAQPVDYRPVERDGAARAAARIAELL